MYFAGHTLLNQALKRQILRHFSRAIALMGIVFALALSSCTLFEAQAPKVALESLRLSVLPNANDNSPIAIEIVTTTDLALAATLSTLPANKWFAQKQQFQNDFADKITVWRAELPPSQQLKLDPAPFYKTRSYGVFLFANYYSAGDHRARLEAYEKATIRFEATEFTVSQEP